MRARRASRRRFGAIVQLRRGGLLALVVAILCGVGVSPAWAGSWQALVTDASLGASAATPVDLGTNTAGAAVATGGSGGLGVAIAPDGRTAYVVDAGATGATGQITPIDLTTNSPRALATIDIPNGPGNFIAIAPNGAKAYMTDPRDGKVFPVDLTTSPATVGSAIPVGGNPEGIAFSPDGATAYVAENANTTGPPEVLPITVASDTPGPPITGLGPHPFSIAITPDGATAYVGDAGSGTDDKVYPVDLRSQPATVGTPITLGGGSTAIAIAPDGSRAYAANGSAVTPITLPSNAPGTPIAVSGGAWALAVTPDSKTVYVTNDTGSTITPVDAASGTPGTPIGVTGAPRGIAITPDQAPTAAFNIAGSQVGSAITFDGSPSSTPVGTITSYAWDFGDGQSQTTSTATTTHTYATAGSYTITLAVTNSAGTSTKQVFTGQTVSQEGGPGARTSRTLVVSSAPAPAVSLSAGHLDFGTIAVGASSAPQTVTATNAGGTALHLGAVSVNGAVAADYTVGADSCTGATVGPGATCAVALTFVPHAGGARAAMLQLSDDAPGGPQVVSLAGSGTTTGIVAGTVHNGGQFGAPPVSGARVQICPHAPVGSCQFTTTGSDGRYAFANLTPGQWAMEVATPITSLFDASAIVAVAPGSQTQDFTLSPPRPLPADVMVTSVLGQSSGGVPTLFWNAPATISYPADFPAHAPNTEAAYFTSVALYNAGNDSPGAAPISSGSMVALVSYDSQGRPRIISQYPDPQGGPDPTVSFTTAGATPHIAHGGRVGGSHDPVGRSAGYPVPTNVIDELTLDISEAFGFKPDFGDDSVIVELPSPQEQTHGATTITIDKNTFVVPEGSKVTVNPDGSITIQTPNGTRPPDACQVRCSPNGPGGGGTSATGSATYDPSGQVRTTHGIPLANARVVLLRSSANPGPFTAVANGSTEMSPGNRRNPDHTNALGLFGWDVVAGFYRVSAQHPGCTATRHRSTVRTPSYAVPPPRANLVLKLTCPQLPRAASHTVLRATGIDHRTAVMLTATVRGAPRNHPTGLLSFRAAGRTLRTVPVSPRGHAVLVIAGLTGNTFSVRYEGDGYNRPSAARAERK